MRYGFTRERLAGFVPLSNLKSSPLSYVSESSPAQKLKALIVPHGNFDQSGEVQAKGYVNVDANQYNTVFLIGPSHNTNLENCGLVVASHYETPIGDLEVDLEIVSELRETELFVEFP